jgi:hypothetical protein
MNAASTPYPVALAGRWRGSDETEQGWRDER